ncbi:MAG: hypothetical protein EPN79_13290 [Burkholderiaceae bacterium]|nr:MAG: hypothetical protein EPN79_13290 [Burkholderiaceae bacterium]TBR73217.1 MAG: hypothetical protein EPN64_17035 [Burkholderiaceae bacterium]
MTPMPDFDPEKFLKTPIYAFDFQFMIGDVKDFLVFSESNIDWQHRRELQAISHRQDLEDYPSGYREHLEENANHRFLVSLPLRVRYAAVLALTTSVEWSVKFLNMRAVAPVTKKGDGANQTVTILRELVARTQLSAGSAIDDYEALINVRNCIVHSAGLFETYQFKDTLPVSVDRLRGCSLANWHFFGDQVCIERGALDQYIDEMSKLVVDLHQSMHESGLMQP